ncbi:uncharacterized protein PAC_08770 [Phialocephala subalpina]|uniref:Heterokaryon incompatibility domain-containing protein n=1 Tax=Phialocephala subalpina TaxID=576137 RepID=A0A1L7X1H7_9HELO|nr:uncharacterized protein PAC_08770 [Phialocephala subalpina]
MKVFASDYQALQEKDEIRLLYLHPGSSSDPIKCTITHARLSSKPVYEALSYMWGDEPESRVIVLDDRSRRIRENLWYALYHLRNPDILRTLWVDAICIDQNKNSERNHQVSQMGIIYSEAVRVCVWLGKSTPSIAHAMDFLNRNFSAQDRFTEPAHEFPFKFNFYDNPWLDFACLADLPYWRRLWIIQEVSLAAEIMIYCWDMIVPWETLCRCIDGLLSHPSYHGFFRHTPLWTIYEQRQKFRLESLSQRPSLQELVRVYNKVQCSDVRDRAYGLYSLVSPCCSGAVPVDYACSNFELCRRILAHELSHHIQPQHQYSISYSIIHVSARLHEELHGTTPWRDDSVRNDVEQPGLPDTIPSRLDMRLRLRGTVVARISDVTPCIQMIAFDETWMLPDTVLANQNRVPAGLDAERTLRIRRAVDLVGLLPSVYVSDVSYGIGNGDTNLSVHPDIPQLSNNPSRNPLLGYASEYSKTLLSATNSVAFCERSGAIGFCPAGAGVGDFVCRTKGDALIVVSERADNYMVVGRALLLHKHALMSLPLPPRGSNDATSFEFDIGLDDLQMLTRMSQCDLDRVTGRQKNIIVGVRD